MKYFYFHPLKRQYFFPDNFQKHEVFLSFYQSYSLFGSLSWWLFINFKYYRYLFRVDRLEKYIPVERVLEISNSNGPIAFNLGTPGLDQKITGLGLDDDGYYFLKYAKSSNSIKNVSNEYKILNCLKELNFVPKTLSYYSDSQQVLLKTNIFNGRKLKYGEFNDLLLDYLFTLARIKIDLPEKNEFFLKSSFAHGDFCPWNIMIKDEQIHIFDWEMGGVYPLGYDLFTFIFQTNFVLNKSKKNETILLEFDQIIKKYFDHFKVTNWSDYLTEFCDYKILKEKIKGNNRMVLNYQLLKEYAEKV